MRHRHISLWAVFATSTLLFAGAMLPAPQTERIPMLPAVRAEPPPSRTLEIGFAEDESVHYWVRQFSNRHREMFAHWLSRGERYKPLILGKIQERGLPMELYYLAMIESGFKPTAKSRVGARGLWQFMPGTARLYGLRVGRGVDERVHVARSTDAALRHLAELHDLFGSWHLAAAAYNCGAGCVQRALKAERRSGAEGEPDYFQIRGRLPKETQAYVPRLIAAATIGQAPEKYGFPSAEGSP